jgi:DNA-binding transcriptional LysR family regulator
VRPKMELRHLRYFVAVAEEENVTRAAEKLHVSQPALSRQVRDLEDELGISLLERKAHSVELTDAGRMFLEEARAVLQRAEQAVKAVRTKAGGKETELQAGYAPSLTVEILPQAMRAFEKKFPAVRVILHDLSTEEMLDQLRAEKLDVALGVRASPKMLRGLRFIELACYPICLAVPPTHRLARARSVPLAELQRERLIGYSKTGYPEYHEQMQVLLTSRGQKQWIAEDHDSVTSLIAGIEAGQGVALVPSCLRCMVGPRLKLMPLKPRGPEIIVGATVRMGETPEIVEEFINEGKASRPDLKN